MSLILKMKDFFCWFRIVLTFGDVIEMADDSGDQWTVTTVCYNGKVASLQLFLVMTAVCLSLSFWRLMANTFGAAKTAALLAFMLLGLGILLHFNVHRSRILSPRQSDSPPPPRDNIPLFGISLFYFFGCAVDIFQMFLSTSCFDVWRTCRTAYYTATGWLHLCFHVVRIVYLGAQTLFCVVFDGSTMVDCCSTRCGLMYLAAVNVCLSVDCFVDTAFNLIVAGNPVDNPKVKCFADDSNVSVEAIQCLRQNTTMFHFLNTYVSSIYIPIAVQMAVLTGQCLGHLFDRCTARPPAGGGGGDYLRSCVMDRSAGTADYERLLSDAAPNNPDDDEEPYTDPLDGGNYIRLKHSSETTSGEDGPPNPPPTATWQCRLQLAFLLAFLVNAVLLGLAILHRIHSEATAYLYYDLPFRALMLAATVAGFALSRPFQVLRGGGGGVSFSALDYVLLVSSMGHLQLSLIAFIPRAIRGLGLLAVEKLLNAAQGCLQTTFALYSARVTSTLLERRRVFECLVFFLAVSNGTLWLVETCIGLILSLRRDGRVDQRSSVEATYYGSMAWSAMNNTLVPFDLMFHLLSCFAFARTFLSQRPKSRAISRTEHNS